MDNFRKYNYDLQIDGLSIGRFSEISILDIPADPIGYRATNTKVTTPMKQPGLIKHGNIVLKYGIITNNVLYDWFNEVKYGKINRKTVVIIVQDDKHNEKAKWSLINSWPIKYTASDMNAIKNGEKIEKIEFSYEDILREIIN